MNEKLIIIQTLTDLYLMAQTTSGDIAHSDWLRSLKVSSRNQPLRWITGFTSATH